MYKAQEHPYKILKRVIASGDIPSVILLYGNEGFMIDWACRSLKKALINPATESLDYTVFDEANTQSAEVIAACETIPFMSERKMVVLKNLDLELGDYIDDLPSTCLLLIINEKVDKRKSFFKKIEKIGLAYNFTALDESTLVSWVQKRIPGISKEDILHYANDAGYFDDQRDYNLYNFENDLKKAAALYQDQAKISYEDLINISSMQDETNAFKLLDAAFSNDKAAALKLLNSIINAEQSSKQISAILKFHGLLCSQLEIMVEARERKEAGVAADSSVNAYRLKKAVQMSERLTTARLKSALSACYRIESDIKSGRMDARLCMELFIAKI